MHRCAPDVSFKVMSAPEDQRRWFGREEAVLLAVIVAGFLLREYAGWWRGHLQDLQQFQSWALDPGEHLRGSHGAGVQCNYPPVYPIVLRLMRGLHRTLHFPGDFTQPVGLIEEDPGVRPIILWLKQPAIVADVFACLLIYIMGCRLGRRRLGLAAASLYFLSPALIHDGAYYGQTDTILVAVLIGLLAAWQLGYPVCVGALLVTATLLKAQAFPVLIVLLAAILSRTPWSAKMRWKRIVLGGALALGAVVALAAWTGQLRQFHAGYAGIVGEYPQVTINALNAWWLALRPWDKIPQRLDYPVDTDLCLGLVMYRTVGLIVFAAMMCLILWRLHVARYSPYAVALASTAAAWAFFHLPTEMHERYSVPAVGLIYVIALWEPRWLVWATIASIAALANMVLVCPLMIPSCRGFCHLVNWPIRSEEGLDWTVLALIQIAMLLLTLAALWGMRSLEPNSEKPRDKTVGNPLIAE